MSEYYKISHAASQGGLFSKLNYILINNCCSADKKMSTSLLRRLGKNGPEVPAMGYGLMGLSQPVYGTVSSEEDKFAMLDRAYELGARHWDSSE